MIPRKREWREWDAMDKATYVAQILAPVALLVTVVFSYMSWREARYASQIQERLFTAQSSPRLQLSRAETGLMDGGQSVGFTLKNFGESDARNVCVQILYRFQPIHERCMNGLGGTRAGDATIARDETLPFLLNLTGPRFDPVGFVPTSAHIVDENARAQSCRDGERAAIISIFYRYENAVGASLAGGDDVLLCG